MKQLEETGALEILGADTVLPAGDRVLASQRKAVATAQAWLAEPTDQEDADGEQD